MKSHRTEVDCDCLDCLYGKLIARQTEEIMRLRNNVKTLSDELTMIRAGIAK